MYSGSNKDDYYWNEKYELFRRLQIYGYVVKASNWAEREALVYWVSFKEYGKWDEFDSKIPRSFIVEMN